jgi:hypothetical protein
MSTVEPAADLVSESGSYYAPTSEVHGQSILTGSIDYPSSPMTVSTQSSSYSGIPIKDKFERLQTKNIFDITDGDRRHSDVELKLEATAMKVPKSAAPKSAAPKSAAPVSSPMMPSPMMSSINTAPSSFNESQQAFPTTRSSKYTARTNPMTARSMRETTPYAFGLTDDDYNTALPPLGVNAKSTVGGFQVQVLAKRLLERPSETKKRMPQSASGNLVMPVYFRDEMPSARSTGDVSTASSEDDVLMRAYAAALGVGDGDNDDISESGGVHEQLSELLSSIQSARQHASVSHSMRGSKHLGLENTLPAENGVSADATQEPRAAQTQSAESSMPVSPRHHEYTVEQDGGDSIGSTDAGDHLDDYDPYVVTRKDFGYDMDYEDDEDDIDNEMRETLRQSRVQKRSSTPSSNHVRTLSASHSANAIVRGARADTRNATAGPQRAKICTSPLRTSRKPSLKPVISGGGKLPSIPTVGLSSKKGMGVGKRSTAMSASASDSVLKRNALMTGLQKPGQKSSRTPIVDMSKSLSMLSTTS